MSSVTFNPSFVITIILYLMLLHVPITERMTQSMCQTQQPQIFINRGTFLIYGINLKQEILNIILCRLLHEMKGFSYDYAFGRSYDDDDLLLRIISNQDNRIVCCHHTTSHCGGIHLFHVRNSNTTGWDHGINGRELNDTLYNAKKKYVDKYKKYIEVSETVETFDEVYATLARC